LTELPPQQQLQIEGRQAAGEDGLWDANLVTGELVVDENWTATLGYSKGEILPQTAAWDAVIHPDDLQRVIRVRSKHLAGAADAYEVEHRLLTASGPWKLRLLSQGLNPVEVDKKGAGRCTGQVGRSHSAPVRGPL
jgi:PAS domain-containing protein